MSPATFELHLCNYCSRQLPKWRVHPMASRQAICDHCLEWHYHALDFLGGAVPRGCQHCGITWETLRDQTIGPIVRMYVVPKDGVLQLLCGACIRPYTGKRSDLYQGTEYGRKQLQI